MARASASSLLPRLTLWRAARSTAAQEVGSGTKQASTSAQASASASPVLPARLMLRLPASSSSSSPAFLSRGLHTTRPAQSSSLWSRLVRSSGASSDPLGTHLSVTNALIAANLAAALAAASGLAPNLPSSLARANWMVSPGGEWYRLLTAGFVHTGWIHLLVNVYALHALRDLEHVFGGRRYLAVFLLSVVAGNWLALHETPAYAIGCGASSGVAGVVFAYVAARLANRRVSPVTLVGTFGWVAQVVGLNLLVQALSSGGGGGTRIDQWGHLGGALGGAAAALLLGPRLQWAAAGGRRLVDAPPLPILLWRGGRVPPGW